MMATGVKLSHSGARTRTSGIGANPPLPRVPANGRRLLDAVTVEINRRNQGDAKKKDATAGVAETLANANLYRFRIKGPAQSTRFRKEKQISSERHFGQGLSLWP
jgi:hypothetical protein